MELAPWAVIAGGLLIVTALSGTVLARLPLSTAMLYLAVGMIVSPLWLGLAVTGPIREAQLLEPLAEVAVLVSLFSAGLKLSPHLKDRRWRLPLRLAVVSMLITVLLISLAGMLMGLPVGAAILLGAILAPTDPVLAADVQVHSHADRDRLRFALTGEAGLNDGTAFPFVLLGLGLLGLHDIGTLGWRWLALDVLWGVSCGLLMGTALGAAVGRLVLHLRRRHQEAVGLDDFLAMGLIGLSYGVAVLLHGYGFLSVFAAGVALRQLEQRETRAAGGLGDGQAVARAQADPEPGAADAQALAVDARHAPAYMAHAVLGFNEKLERIGEMAMVIVIGALLWAVPWPQLVWWFVPVLLLVIRPVAVTVGLIGSTTNGTQRWLISWFGIRGIGSLYYLAYAINHGLPKPLAEQITALTLGAVFASIVLHGVSVTPLMRLYERSRPSRQER